jgi:hypothetical protein
MYAGETSDGAILEWLIVAGAPLVLLLCAVITAAKGRWGWFLGGLLTAGVAWLAAAPLLIARPDSLWARRFYGPRKLASAERAFPHRARTAR